MTIDERDLTFLSRALDLAEAALIAGDQPFGSVLVGPKGEVLFEDHNRVNEIDATQHPELAAARWAGQHLDATTRAACTVYTSTEHCPMCATAHGWVGLGRIVCACTSAQLGAWAAEAGLPPLPILALPVTDLVPGAVVDGPAPSLTARARALHERSWASLREV